MIYERVWRCAVLQIYTQIRLYISLAEAEERPNERYHVILGIQTGLCYEVPHPFAHALISDVATLRSSPILVG